MTREQTINQLLPELNDIGRALSDAYKALNEGTPVSIEILAFRMATIMLRAKTVFNTIKV